MAKSKFKRSNVKSQILKKVIIRVDFEGLTDIVGCVNTLKPIMNDKFRKFSPINKSNFNIKLNHPKSQSPVDVDMEQKTLYQFSDSAIGKSEANFMFGPDFAYIEIKCSNDYEGCNEYIKLMANIIDDIVHFDAYISIKRLGLRKVDVVHFDTLEQLNQSVECPIWENYAKRPVFRPLKTEDSDLLYQKDVHTIFNIRRTTQLVRVQDQEMLQYILDIDAYKECSFIRLDDLSTVENIEKMISEQMNEPMFDYFIGTFTEKYLETFYHE